MPVSFASVLQPKAYKLCFGLLWAQRLNINYLQVEEDSIVRKDVTRILSTALTSCYDFLRYKVP